MHRLCRLLVAIVTIWLGAAGQAAAASAYDDASTPEGWAWDRIKQGQQADFNDRCNTTTPALDPRAKADSRWTDRCRRLPASFLVDILTRSPWREEVPVAGVVIVGAQIEGEIDLRNARLNRGLVLRRCLIAGGMNLDAARTDSPVEVVGSRIEGAFIARRFRSELWLVLSESAFERPVSLVGARIDGRLDMDGAGFEANLNADGLQVGDSLFMRSNDRSRATFKEVFLVAARVARNVEMSGATFDGDLVADGLQIGAYLFLRSEGQHKASFKGVLLRNARVTGTVEMGGATIDGDLIVEGLQVGGNLYMRSDDQHRASFKGVLLRNANIIGSLDLSGATFDGDLSADGLQVGGNLFMQSDGQNEAQFKTVNLAAGRITGSVDVSGATFDGNLSADGLQVGAYLVLRSTDQRRVTFKGVVLRNARVVGSVQIFGATFDQDLSADGLQVGGNLHMYSDDRNRVELKKVDLTGAKVTGSVEMSGVALEGDLSADGLQVGAYLILRSTDQRKATFKGVVLRNARVTGTVEMGGATFDDDLFAEGLQVGGSLHVYSDDRNKALFKKFDLTGAKVAGTVAMDATTFDGDLIVEGLQAGGSLYMRNIVGNGLVNMIFVQTSGSIDLRGATLMQLDLSGASIAGDLRLGGAQWRDAKDKPADLMLRNARVANLMDTKDAWPARERMHIDGFAFQRLGGIVGDTGPNMRARGMQWWDDWVRRDPDYTPTPYEQLAAAFAAAGDRSAADDIRYLGRVRQREMESGPQWVLSGFLQYVAGFGIGDYTFRVVYWVAGISLAGGLYLWTSVPRAREHGPIWCFGASLSRLLPVIEINKEFSDFFNDPKRRRLTGLQSFVFSVVGMTGWLLGAILVAAVSGLTQKP